MIEVQKDIDILTDAIIMLNSSDETVVNRGINSLGDLLASKVKEQHAYEASLEETYLSMLDGFGEGQQF